MKNKTRQIIFPTLAALIWGTAFVAQSVSTDHVGPFAFNASRSIIAFFVLLAVSALFKKVKAKRGEATSTGSKKDLIIGGICCGIVLAAASNFQQAGLADTAPGKAGFITALYVVLVPVLGIFLRRKASLPVWVGAVLAVGGLYLLCIKDGFSVEKSDLLVLVCAFIFAMHIMCVDHFVQKTDGVMLSCVQFLTAGVVSAVLSLIFEKQDISGIIECALPILYVGVFSSGVAYTLQILAQKDSDPTVVSILLSLESVFSVLAGAVILGDRLSGREYLGCVLMFAAVVLAQLPWPPSLKDINQKL
ncbi:MAG: DMT family transporter [Oscillospiraceae bacterium]|nr:DMT family transporter [Oscillospiraceae bacterium]